MIQLRNSTLNKNRYFVHYYRLLYFVEYKLYYYLSQIIINIIANIIFIHINNYI